MKKIALYLALALAPSLALAQSTPNLQYGQVPTAAQWNSYFAKKQDYSGSPSLPLSGGVLTGKLVTAPSTTASTGFSIPQGVAPTSPNNGDVWTTSAGIFVQIAGTTVGPLSPISGANFLATQPLTVSASGGNVTYGIGYDSSLALSSGLLSVANAPAGTLTGATLAANVTASSLTSVGTLTAGGTGTGFTVNFTNSTFLGTIPAANTAALTGDVTKPAGSNATTLPTVNSNVGAFGSATVTPIVTVNAKGQVTAVTTATTAPPFTAITGQLAVAQLPASSANVLFGNLVAGTGAAFAMPSCSTSASALLYTTGTGFSCNTAIVASSAASAPAGTLTGSTLAAGVTSSSLTSFGASPTLATPIINGLPTGTGVATANTPSTVVARDASGNFSAGTVTAALSGNATTSTTAGSAPAGTLTGTTLNATVTGSSLTGVGTLGAGSLGVGFTTVAIARGGSGQTSAQAARSSAGFNIDQMTTNGDSNLTIAATTRTVATTATLTAPRTFTLPAASALNPGQSLVILDQQGGINGVNTITMARAGSDTINGVTSAPISTQYGGMILTTDGVSKWTSLATGGGGGGGSGTVTNVTAGTGITGGTITTSGTLGLDPGVVQGYKAGLTLSTAGSSSTFGTTPGVATDSGNVAFMVLGSAITKTTATWALGSATGALDTGTIANSTWYHVFVMRRPDTGVVDQCVSTTVSGCVTGAAIPTAYTQFRRVGSMKTNGSAQWTAFTQSGNYFQWDVQVVDGNSLAPGNTTSNTLTISTPPGVKTVATLNALGTGSNTSARAVISSLNTAIPSGINYNVGVTVVVAGVAAQQSASQISIETNTASQIRYMLSDATGGLYIVTSGWTDNFGGPAGAGAAATAPSANVLQNYISGYTLSTAGSSATYSLSTGSATDSLNASFIVLANAISKTTSAWAVGNAAGGLDSGTIANSTWYHAFVIQRPDTGVVDSCVSTSVSGCTVGGNIPAAYTQQRRVGSMLTNSSGQWTKFVQNGNEFTWDAPLNNVGGLSNPGTAGVLRAVSVPPGVTVQAKISLVLIIPTPNTDSPNSVFLSDPAISDTVATAVTLSTYNGSSATAGATAGGSYTVGTNTASQIRTRFQNSSAGLSFYLNTNGWTDTRNGPNITGGNAGVASFNGRSGVVAPAANDYSAAQIGTTGAFYRIKSVTITATGNYTPSVGLVYAKIRCVGGGGGGGGVVGAGVGNNSNGAGGGGGGTPDEGVASAATIGAFQAVTIGGGGAGGVSGANNGSSGGTTSLGSLCNAPGGGGGTGTNGPNAAAGGIGGAAGLAGFTGAVGGNAYGVSGFPSVALSGAGASSLYGGGGQGAGVAANSTNGNIGTGYGSGGSGGASQNTANNAAGGPGRQGAVFIDEYLNQ